jgi:hypothetical protein
MPFPSRLASGRRAADKLTKLIGSVPDPAVVEMNTVKREGEGGHMSSTHGHVVLTPNDELPYKVVLTHEGLPLTERYFATMRESEACIRRNTPRPLARSTLRDAPYAL